MSTQPSVRPRISLCSVLALCLLPLTALTARGQTVTPAASVAAGDIVTLTISGLPVNTNNPLVVCTLTSGDSSTVTVPDSVTQTKTAGGVYNSTLTFRATGIRPGGPITVAVEFSDPAGLVRYSQVTVSNPTIVFNPDPIVVDQGETIAVTIARPSADADAELELLVYRAGGGCAVGLGLESMAVNYNGALSLAFNRYQTTLRFYVTGLAFRDLLDDLVVSAGGVAVASTVVVANGFEDFILTPFFADVVAGNTFNLTVSGLPITTNNAQVTLHYYNEDDSRIFLTNVYVQPSLGEPLNRYASSMTLPVLGIRKVPGLFEPIPIHVSATMELGGLGNCQGGAGGTFWTNTTYVTVLNPTFSFNPASPALRVGDTMPLVIKRTALQANGNLYFTLYTSDEALMGLSTNADSLAVGREITLMFEPFEWSKTFYLHGQGMALSYSTNVVLTARVGGYATNLPVAVSPNVGLVLTPLTNQVPAGDTLAMTVSRASSSNVSPLTVLLSVDNPSVFSAPASVTIPAGASSIAFPVTGLLPGASVLRATAIGVSNGVDNVRTVTVTAPSLTFAPSPASNEVGEARTIRVLRPATQAGADLRVELRALNEQVFVLATNRVVIPAGYSSAAFDFTGLAAGQDYARATVGSYGTNVRVTVTGTGITFTPSPIAVGLGSNVAVVIARPTAVAASALDLTVRLVGGGCALGLGLANTTVNYADTLSARFEAFQTNVTIYVSGLAFGTKTGTLTAVAGLYSNSTTAVAQGYTAPILSPMLAGVVAGDLFTLTVTNLPTPTNNAPVVLYYDNEDGTRISVANVATQYSLGSPLNRYADVMKVPVRGIQKMPGLFEPIPIHVSATMELGGPGNCQGEAGGVFWTNTTYVTVLNPTFAFSPASPALRVSETVPVAIKRTALQANANLYFTLYSGDEAIMGLSTNADSPTVGREITLMFAPFEWSKTFYLHGLALSLSHATNVLLTARVGGYATNLPVAVTPNVGLVLTPLTPSLPAGDTLAMTVSRSSATNVSPLTVYLTVDNPAIFSAPASVTIPAGASSISFPVTGLVPGESVIRATAVGVSNGTDNVRSVAVINPRISFAPTPVSNEVGEVRAVSVLRPSNQAGADLAVALAILTPGYFSLSTNLVTIPAGHIGASFTIAGLVAGQGFVRGTVGNYNTNLLTIVGEGVNNDDPDRDGVSSEDEYRYGWDPYDAYSQDPARLQNDGQYDNDHDGLSNLSEIQNYRTDPTRADTDDDGVNDGVEVSADLTNPLQPMSSRNYYERSLDLSKVPPAGLAAPQPSRFNFATNGWTVESWFRPVSDGTGQVFSLGLDGTNVGFRVGLENYRPKVDILSGSSVLVTAGGTNASAVGDIQKLPTNEWSHLAFVWAPDRNSLEVYVNGILLIARESLAEPSFGSASGVVGSGFTNGYLDDLRVWNYDRSWEEVSHWFNRIYPAPSDYIQTPSYGTRLKLYYRFDDDSSNTVDFAYLNDTNYFIRNTTGMTTTNPAISLLGSDDEDGDLIPEWWAQMHSLNDYPAATTVGPALKYFADPPQFLARIEYFKAFRAYGSIGASLCEQVLGPDRTDNLYHAPKDTGMGFDGRYLTCMRYVYLYQQPAAAELRLFTPGMTTAVAYVDGKRVTPEGQQTNEYQVLNIASYLHTGRNMIYVRCDSRYNFYLDEARTEQIINPNRVEYYEGVYGKFDASLTVDGAYQIVRGDYGRNDPRSVWYCQTWSTYNSLGREEQGLPDPMIPDREGRSVPGNQDFGLPFDADTDNFNAYYEYFCGTNPRDNDSNNNGIPDDLEDFDNDGLRNGDEQTRGSSPLLPDTDDDSVVDGLDAIGDNDPASALSPLNTKAMALGGGQTDYVEIPRQKRFALDAWTVEGWVKRDAGDSNGGVVCERVVGPKGMNYQLGLGDGSGSNAPVNVPYIRYTSVEGTNVVATNTAAAGTNRWIHLAGSYDAERRQLKLYVNGALANVKSDLKPPAIYAGGPVNQRIGRGIQGFVDEVRIWGVARAASDILANYAKTVPMTEPDLVAYYRFDDDTSYRTNPVLVGTSANNWTNVLPWTWGQAQDYAKAYNGDWWEKWNHGATLRGRASFTANGGGAIDNPPSLQVYILPSEATGAQWRVSSFGDWNGSGYTISDGLMAGEHILTFSSIYGWTAPADVTVALSNNMKTVVTVEYTQNGGIKVDIAPPDVVAAPTGAMWRVDNGEWRSNSVTVYNLTPAGHYVEFSAVSGWMSPAATNLMVRPGLITPYIGTYSNIAGSIQVYIEPAIARTTGGRWHIDSGVARESGDTAAGLTFGPHILTFDNAYPWEGNPPSMQVTLNTPATFVFTNTYIMTNVTADIDQDGLLDIEEVTTYHTDPLRPDTDDDGVKDGQEIKDITHPLHPMSSLKYFERSLNLAAFPAAGTNLPDQSRFLVDTGGWTVETWVRPGTDGTGRFFSLGCDGTNTGFRVGLDNYRPKAEILSGNIVLVSAGGMNSTSVGDIQQLPRDEWTHLAYVWSPERNTLEVYINGVLLIARESLAAPAFVAGPAVFAQGFADGYVDDFRVWSYDRTWEEVSYWHNRLFPAPAGYISTPTYGNSMLLYYRFDDGASNVVDFAHLNNPAYFIMGTAAAVTTNQAVSLLGNDDEDGDFLPEWWVQVHNLDKYPNLSIGPRFIYALIEDCFYEPPEDPVYTNFFDKDDGFVARVDFYRTFNAYGSIGGDTAGGYAWLDPVDNMYYAPKDTSLGADGRYSVYQKYVYIETQPKEANLNLFTPGMTQIVAYVNGGRVTPVGQESNAYQSVDIANQLHPGRNMLYIRCVSSYNKFLNEARTDLAGMDYDCNHFEGIQGKFDASLMVDGKEAVRRGDHTRNDPRAVWVCQAWSTYREMGGDPPYADLEDRALPGNTDYGLPIDADSDTLNAYYELRCRTNPRDDDSDNNGVPDGLEDFDGDGLLNLEEQTRHANPVLPDTDDDGVIDGLDVVGNNDPSSALSPLFSRAMVLSGSTNDFVSMPIEPRFALTDWTIEAWVYPNAAETNGGILIQRVVGPQGLNYELGLGSGAGAGRRIPYARFASVDGVYVMATNATAAPTGAWTHVAAVYDAGRRTLQLFVDGTLGATAPVSMKTPALYAGGPIQQRIGAGIDGRVDEVRLWDVARTSDQIANSRMAPVAQSEAGLVAYYRFDDGTSFTNPPLVGTSANNLSSNGVTARPWTWGQVQDYVKAYETDWQDNWLHCASLKGNARFSAAGEGRLDNPPMLQVNLLPLAVQLDARWMVDGGGAWFGSGYTLREGLSAGLQTILFNPVAGWSTPSPVSVTLTNNQLTIVEASYVQNGSLLVTISPPAVVATGALWRVDGREWVSSGVPFTDLVPGPHYVEFLPVIGWNTPPATNLTVSSGQATSYIGTYSLVAGSLVVTIDPQSARDGGAQWRVDGGAWQASGSLLSGLLFGSHTVSFSNALPWVAPVNDVTVILTSSNVVSLTMTYILINGGQSDYDGDGLSDSDEIYVYGTDPRRPDSDDDGVNDGVEAKVDLTNPLQPMSSRNYYERSLDLSKVPLAGLTAPQPSRFNFATNGWTVESWFRPVSDGNGQVFSLGLDGTNVGFRVGLENYRPKVDILSGSSVLVTAGGTNASAVGDIQQLPTNEWSHMAFVWSPDRNSLEVYVNGILLIARESPADPRFISASGVVGSGFTNGYLDDLRVWNYDRSWEEVSYWFNRIFPAPSDYVQTPSYSTHLKLYYRFDDDSSNTVDFAYLNDTNYFIWNTTGMTATNPAVSLLGSDDADGDLVPEWWAQMQRLNDYPAATTVGPTLKYFDGDLTFLARIEYFKAFRAYGSVGASLSAQVLGPDRTDNLQHSPKDTSMGFDGRYLAGMKYIYLYQQPATAELRLFTPGMITAVAYVDGKRVTPEGEQTNEYQVLNIASYLHMGRNMIYVRCESLYNFYLDEARTEKIINPKNIRYYEGMFGKFDASLTVDGTYQIVRGDYSRNDPRSVWYCQTWSTYNSLGREEQGLPDPMVRDSAGRSVPGNQDYGLPFNSDTDGMNAYYEYLVGTNPRDDDSNNNGVPDNEEDYDGDGLLNGEEQDRSAHPQLPDTDDDGLTDALDASGDNDPANPITPMNTRAIVLGGGAGDYVEFPKARRFALTDWTVEAWVNRSASETDGGVLVERQVRPGGVNYQIGLGDGIVAPVNAPYVRFSSVAGKSVATNSGVAAPAGAWTHVAGTYYAARRELTLVVNGTSVFTVPSAMDPPATWAGGPVVQRIGAGIVGRMDEVRIWDEARTPSTIASNALRIVLPASPGLVAYYRFDDSTSYTNLPALVGTSANNGTNGQWAVMPWTWGQVQDYTTPHFTDWWEKWLNSASLRGKVAFSTNGSGAVGNPPALRVRILPLAAADGGASWTVSGLGHWYASDYTLMDLLSEGPATILFSDVPGWRTPPNIQVTLSNNILTTVEATYMQNGNLQVYLAPQSAIDAGALWRVDGGAGLASGAVVSNLVPGRHLVEFMPMLGWTSPSATNLSVVSGQTTGYIGIYTLLAGGLRVFIEPSQARNAGAQWQVDGGAWQYSGFTTSGLSFGTHTLTFSRALPWVPVPSNATVNLTSSDVAYYTNVYTLVNGGMDDQDSDGLNDFDEVYIYHTDPLRPDSDDDGVNDGVEVRGDLTNPLHPMSYNAYRERSLELGSMPSGGVLLPDWTRFAFANHGWSVEAWYRPGADGTGWLFSLGDDGVSTGFRVGLDKHRPKAQIFYGTNILVTAGGTNAAGSIQALRANEWTHVAYVWSPGRNSLEIFVNGVLLIAKETLAVPYFDYNYGRFADEFSDGHVDDVRVWDYDRSWEEVSYWHERLFPAPSSYMDIPNYGQSLMLYYRFDDGGSNVEDFAAMNNTNYVLPVASMRTTNYAVSLLGSDDEDGDLIPEWWAQVHKLLKYPTYTNGPTTEYFDAKQKGLAMVSYYRSFRAYGSVGGPLYCWCEPVDSLCYCPKDSGLGPDGRYSAFMKYVHLNRRPASASLSLFTPGMTGAVAYVNGQRVTAEADATNAYQTIDVAGRLQAGRNMIVVYCESDILYFKDEARTTLTLNPETNHWEGMIGKFDARLTCDGTEYIKRGDTTRNDPRAAWFCQTWSSFYGSMQHLPIPDQEMRDLPGNQDYGLPYDADTDGLNALYEYFTLTNPRDDDSNNNGVKDNLEDYDGDGLLNGEEQMRGAHPRLPDTDDDGVLDGPDAVGDNDPASAMSPVYARSIVLGGGSNDYVSFPQDLRFALTNWTVEAWVYPAAGETNGGIAIRRAVGPSGVNFEIGLGNGANAPINVPYVKIASVSGDILSANSGTAAPLNRWTHLAGIYDASRHELKLVVNATNSYTVGTVLQSPAIFAGGPVIQRIGEGILGRVDEARIWNVALSTNQIASNYNRIVSGDMPGLLAYYRFDDGTSFTNRATPIGTSANNGTNGQWNIMPWAWGQVQDYTPAYFYDWWDNWRNSALLNGNAAFSTNNGGAIGTTPMLKVTLLPAAAAAAGAQWSISSPIAWHNSEFILDVGLTAGTNTVIFKTISGWTSPTSTPVTVSNGLTTLTATYVAGPTTTNSIRVFLAPALAVSDGARWMLDGGAARTNGEIVAGLALGDHTVGFNSLWGWRSPANIPVTLTTNQPSALLTGTYVRITGLAMFLLPPEARAFGAQWRVLGDITWYNSGVIRELSAGTWPVQFRPIAGWTTFTNVTAEVFNGILTIRTNTYFNYSALTGTPVAFSFKSPRDLYIDAARDVYVADGLNHRISVIHSDAVIATNWGSSGTGAGQFNNPCGVTLDSSGNLWVADTDNHRVQRRSVSTGGWTTWGGPGSGTALGQFNRPIDLAFDSGGNLYVADSLNNRVQRLSTGGVWSQFIGAGAGNGQVTSPGGLFFDASGNLYVADAPAADQGRIQRFTSAGVYRETVGTHLSGQGLLERPRNMAIQAVTNFLAANTGNSMMSIKYLGAGTWSNLFGMGAFNAPEGVAVNNLGDTYIADTGNNRILKIAAGGAVVVGPSMAGRAASGPSGSQFVVAWNGSVTWSYVVQYSTNLAKGNGWTILPGATNLPGVDGVMSFTDSEGAVYRSYRVNGSY